MRILNCCREIRIDAFMRKIKKGDILEGFNTATERYEKVIVVKPENDPNRTVVTPYTDKAFKKYNK